MDDEQLVEKILQSLVELEQEGELVLTTNSGSSVARYILDSALKQLVTTFRDSDAPITGVVNTELCLLSFHLYGGFGLRTFPTQNFLA